MNKKSKNKNQESGQVLLIIVLVLGAVMIAASTIAGYLTLLRIRQATDEASSNKAIYAADSGIQWDLYERSPAADGGRPIGSKLYPSQPVFSNGATLKVVQDPNSTKSIGQYGNTYRALEVSY